jgi:hypothetical protein
MTALDPTVRDLLAALVECEERTRDRGDREHSMAFAHASGVLRSVLYHDVEPRIAATVLDTYGQVGKPLYPELGNDLKRAGEQMARHKAGQ